MTRARSKQTPLAAWLEKSDAGLTGPSPGERRDVRDSVKGDSEEERVVKRILAGDRQAFETLLDRYETRVYRLALRFTNNVPDAEDVTQEVFLGIYRSLPNFRGLSSLSTWIYRIAMNHCLEYRRKRRLDCIPYNEELMLTSQDWREDPEKSAARGELSSQVEAALSRLSPQHRDVVVLHELQGLTYQEVATLLNVPVGTVKSRLSNACRRLRDLMSGYVFDRTEGSQTA